MTVKLLTGPATLRGYAPSAVLDTLRGWAQRQRERRQLLTLDERMLRDVGLDRFDAEREARKPFWMA